MSKLSQHFTLSEAVYSATAADFGIANKPGAQEIVYLALFAHVIAEPLRLMFGDVPMSFSSWFRSLLLNAHPKIKGSKTSAHVDGRAGDLHAHNGFTIDEMFAMIVASDIPFDKVIIERKGKKRWIHIQIAKIGRTPRRRVLAANYDPVKREMIYSIA